MAHDVFICHASEDKVIATAACAKLEAAGIRCWIAPRDPMPGIPYGRQLIEAISEARVVLLIFSGNANRSSHVLRELEVASDANKIIVPFRIEEVVPSGDLRYYITRVHWLDALTPPMERRLDDLVALTQRLLEIPASELLDMPGKKSPAADGRTKTPSASFWSNRSVIAVLVAVLLGLGIGALLSLRSHGTSQRVTVASPSTPKRAQPARVGTVRSATTPTLRVTTPPLSASAEEAVGESYLDKSDWAAAMHWLQLAAAQGNARAEDHIAFMYYVGRGVQQNLATAAYWWQAAATQGDVDGEDSLGGVYEFGGPGVAANSAVALHWFRLAAAKGSDDAENAIADAYAQGLMGLTRDCATAMRWYRLAAARGNENAEAAVHQEETHLNPPC